MNVTIIVSEALRSALEGRRKVELGVPKTADIGDVLQALLALYPKLGAHVPSERRPVRQYLNVVAQGTAPSGVLREGETVYLFGSPVPPPPTSVRSS